MWENLTYIVNQVFGRRTELLEPGKSPLHSKTIWAIVVSTAAVFSAKYLGITLSPEEQTLIVSFVGIVMRFISKGEIGFYEDKTTQ